MQKTKLGKSEYYISKLGLGTVQFGLNYGFTPKKTQIEVNSILDCAQKNGINFIDTAREYGDSEKKIGQYLSNNINEFIIATKLKKLSKNEAEGEIIRKNILNSIAASLSDLKLSHLNVLQLHQTDEYIITNKIFWDTIDNLKKDCLIGAFGVSVYEIEEVFKLTYYYSHLIDFFQVPFNIFDRRFMKVTKILEKYNISVVTRSTFLKGIIPCSIIDLPKDLEKLKFYKINLEKKALQLGMSVSELAILYVYCSKFGESMLLGVDNPTELQRNVEIIENFNCTQMSNIDFSNVLVEDKVLIDPRLWTGF